MDAVIKQVMDSAILPNKKFTLHKPATEVFTKDINLKAFLLDLHAFLVREGFKDQIKPEQYSLAGEWVDQAANLNRTADMFEESFVIIDNGGSKEYEITWQSQLKLPTSDYGWAFFKLNLVVRGMKEKEILEGNNKKVLQSGKWEFRNVIEYQNTIKEDYLKKIPFVKNSDYLKKMYLYNFYAEKVEEEIMFVLTKVKGGVYGIINKHFT